MAGESQMTPQSKPDPSVMTTEQLDRATSAMRDYVDGRIAVLVQRMDDRDVATKVLHETVTRVPTEMQLAIGHLSDLVGEKFASVQTQFQERDTRTEREGRDNKINVDAAFAAQEKLGVKQDEANQKAIDKSEKATNETIVKNADAAEARASSLSDKIDDLKDRVNRSESAGMGRTEQRTESRDNSRFYISLLGAAVAGLTIWSIVQNSKP